MSESLSHYGVPGMKWGVRKSDRVAKKDAKEYTSAKMYYGEGAGTRRKLIKAKVEQRSKNPNYKKAFDQYVSNTDMSKRSDQAMGKRRRTDAVNSTRKTVRGIGHMMRGNQRYASLAAAGIFTVAVAAHKSGVDRQLLAYGKQGVNTILNSDLLRKGKSFFQ